MSVSQLTGYAGHKKGFHTNKATFFKQTLSSSNNEPGKIVIEIYLVVIFLFVNLNNRNKYDFMSKYDFGHENWNKVKFQKTHLEIK